MALSFSSLSRTSSLDSTTPSSSRPTSISGTFSSSATVAPGFFVSPVSARRAYRPPKSEARQQQQQEQLDSLKASVASSLNASDSSPTFPSVAHNQTRSMYSYAPTAPNAYSAAPAQPTPARAPQVAFAPTAKPPKPRGVNKVLSALGYKSASSRSKAAAAQVAAAQQASQASRIAEIKAQNISRIQAAADTLRERGKKVMRSVKKRISSKSPKEEQPATWDEYLARYAAAEIDIEDPPLPPARPDDLPASILTPYEQRAFSPPKLYNEAERQAVVNRLDLLGTKRLAAKKSDGTLAIKLDPSSASVRSHGDNDSLAPSTHTTAQTLQAEAVESMKDNPVFQAIIEKCRDLFDSKVALLSVLDEDDQVFLATGGMEFGPSFPRSASMCTHAIMDDDNNGMVVLDAKEDWRFANGLPAQALGARFYAGVPLLAPAFGDPNAPAVPIGVLCAADDRPRESFTPEQRLALHELAAQATKEVENWCTARMESKINRLEDVFEATALDSLDTPPQTPPAEYEADSQRSNKTMAPAPTVVLPSTPPQSFHDSRRSTHSREGSFSDAASVTSSRRASEQIITQGSSLRPEGRRPSAPLAALGLACTTEAPVTAVAKDIQRVFDQACKMLAKALGFSLVYLVALDLTPGVAPTLKVLASHGLTNPAPSFDPALHLKALRAPEGGLLYRNPRFDPTGDTTAYASGLMIPILECRKKGYVLCGYTRDVEREFEQKDLQITVKFAEELESYVTKLGRSNSQVSLRS